MDRKKSSSVHRLRINVSKDADAGDILSAVGNDHLVGIKDCETTQEFSFEFKSKRSATSATKRLEKAGVEAVCEVSRVPVQPPKDAEVELEIIDFDFETMDYTDDAKKRQEEIVKDLGFTPKDIKEPVQKPEPVLEKNALLNKSAAEQGRILLTHLHAVLCHRKIKAQLQAEKKFMVLELADGRSVRALVSRGKLDLSVCGKLIPASQIDINAICDMLGS